MDDRIEWSHPAIRHYDGYLFPQFNRTGSVISICLPVPGQWIYRRTAGVVCPIQRKQRRRHDHQWASESPPCNAHAARRFTIKLEFDAMDAPLKPLLLEWGCY